VNRILLSAVTVLAFAAPSSAGTLPAVAVYGLNTNEDLVARFNEFSQPSGPAPKWGWNDPTRPRLTATWGWENGFSDWVQTLTYFRPNEDPLVIRKTGGEIYEMFTEAFTNEAGTRAAGTYHWNDSYFGDTAFIWNEQHGYRDLKQMLIDEGIGDLDVVSHLQFLDVTGMSADGRYLLGTTILPLPGILTFTPFLVDIGPASSTVPEPSAVLSWMAIAAAGVVIRRRLAA
jgi:hypothetical protein